MASPQRRRRATGTFGGALEEQLALPSVSRERCGALELLPRLVEAAELCQKIAAHAGQEVVALKRRLRSQPIDELETGGWTERHPERDRAVELHHRGWRNLGERLVQAGHACPVRLRPSTRERMTGRDRGLQCIGALFPAERLGTLERGETSSDEELIPTRAVLIEQ